VQQLAFIPPAASPVRRQYLSLKAQHPDAILFFQLGDFFETFEDDARSVAEACDLVLTSREMGRGERLPMAGVPVHAADAYIARLVERGYHIAICQQMEDPSASARSGSSVVRREITRIITPGTLVDPTLLPAERANYLVAVLIERGRAALAYADVSTGAFSAAEIPGPDHEELLRAELWRLQAAECLLPYGEATARLLPPGAATTVDAHLFSAAEAEHTLIAHFNVASLGALGLEHERLAAVTAGALLRYLNRNQPRASAAIERLHLYDARRHMVLDPATREHLEIVRGARGQRAGSLLHVMDRTRTPMGGRLLASWLGHPLLDREAIEKRLDSVAAFVEHSLFRQSVQECLRPMPDLERLAGRSAQRLLSPKEVLALAHSITLSEALRKTLSDASAGPIRALTARMDPPLDLVEQIRGTIVDEPPAGFGEGVIRGGVNDELDGLRSGSVDGRQWLINLEKRERERTGIKNLKVGYNRVFGYYIEISAAALGQPIDYYRQQETGATTLTELLDRLGYQRRQTLASVERFVTPELRDHEARQTRTQTRMAELERGIFDGLTLAIADRSAGLLATAAAAAEVDALASLAQIAQERRYVRPEVLDEPITEIIGGRHPVVESSVGWESYIPGDVQLLSGERRGAERTEPGGRANAPRIMLLTGPNMAGKTTYGRMALLATVMGQCGSFVPAERARIGLVDRVFLRSGAGDDIAGGQSTFMVEMTETAAILRNATPRSLAFFDEVGRGTSTYDGMAIARAIVEYLASSDHGCRTIFSTHYHELAAIEDEMPGVQNYQMEVREEASRVWFTYRIARGSADRSYGVHVAELAGLPPALVARAHSVLHELESTRPSPTRATESDTPDPLPEVLFELAAVDVNGTTPLDALRILHDLRARANRWLGEHGRGARAHP
jgi:DNA mismatch repair protein MutS